MTPSGAGTDREARLASWLAGVLGAGSVTGLRRLSGGASRETWAFDADDRPLILQCERPGGPPTAGMETEAALLEAARGQGVPVPAVRASGQGGPDSSAKAPVVAGSWIVVERVEGETIPRKILRDDTFAAGRRLLAAQCGDALARIHRIPPESVPGLAVGDQVAQLRAGLDSTGGSHPAFELGLRWLEMHRPSPSDGAAGTVVHGDFRNGNLVVGPDGLRAVLDWELAHLGDPLEDLGWLCVRAWRFGASPAVGGFGEVDELVSAYEATAGVSIDRDALAWWEMLGTLKWGVICMVQAGAHLSGAARSVELAAIGRRVCEVEHDVLLLLSGPHASEPEEPRPMEVEGPSAANLHGIPTAGQLVEAVREFLEGDVLSASAGRVRFHARVAARVLATVERELAAGDGPARAHARRLAALGYPSDRALASAIRAGELDDRWDETISVVRAAVADKLAVANPAYAVDGR